MSRKEFRRVCVKRDDHECVIPSCNSTVTVNPEENGEVHHIIERKLWEDGGYFEKNGASVCNYHHRLAEDNIIPPQAFWYWINVDNPETPSGKDVNIDKWGDEMSEPRWQEYRNNIKYPSTRHLPWSHEQDRDDTSHKKIEKFLGYDLIVSIKMDGSNCMLVEDSENPVRARNGRYADKNHFDMCKKMYWENNLYNKIPSNLQIFGEWLYAKHSIHYGCDCDNPCEDVGPKLRDYFQVFGIYNNKYNIWLSWDKTLEIANQIGLTVVPPAREEYNIGSYDNKNKLWNDLYEMSQEVVEKGHEGIIVRSRYPFYYSQIDERLGKYVRPNHVEEGEKHWSKRDLKENITNL